MNPKLSLSRSTFHNETDNEIKKKNDIFFNLCEKKELSNFKGSKQFWNLQTDLYFLKGCTKMTICSEIFIELI